MTAQTLPYIRLKNSNNSLDLKFSVLQSGRRASLTRTVNAKRTLTGVLDTQVGRSYMVFNLVLKVRETETRTGYGTVSQLKTFFGYLNPNAVPTMDLTYYDNLDSNGDGTGDAYTVRLTGNMDVDMLGFKLDGSNSWQMVPCVLEEV